MDRADPGTLHALRRAGGGDRSSRAAAAVPISRADPRLSIKRGGARSEVGDYARLMRITAITRIEAPRGSGVCGAIRQRPSPRRSASVRDRYGSSLAGAVSLVDDVLSSLLGTTPGAAADHDTWYRGNITIRADVLFNYEIVDCLTPKVKKIGSRFEVITRCMPDEDSAPHSARFYLRLQIEDEDDNDGSRDSCTDAIGGGQKRGNFTLQCAVVVPRHAR